MLQPSLQVLKKKKRMQHEKKKEKILVVKVGAKAGGTHCMTSAFAVLGLLASHLAAAFDVGMRAAQLAVALQSSLGGGERLPP